MEWPWQYEFPPFFTMQPNDETRRKQLDAWCDLILDYCKLKRMFQLDLAESQKSDLFHNKKIDRKCSLEMIGALVDELVRRGRAEWIQADSAGTSSRSAASKLSPQQQSIRGKKCCLILWHTVDEWARLIYDYVDRRALQNTVCTFYELTESSEIKNEKFYQIDRTLFRKALQALNKQNKAEIFQTVDDSTGEINMGVKFF